MTAGKRTIQLRRYELVPGESEAFTAWWTNVLAPVRHAYGFRIDFSYLSSTANEFLWAVSIEGDRDEFDRVEAEYVASPERAAAFENVPQRVLIQHISFVAEIPHGA